ncbi:PREDICTED: uncharacterized protein LOC109584027 [Amphimedon queenslandica]|uniref:Uncharacterized protein n=1 Tax=Amphimedon queenslandica TaxID=400682 RepID=A0AAN0JEP2_AMPQE|nr:PREDICTED: uncharacterized protein LOC109584027 [Amphimedon queenslandica]|eukprot:XP_019855148.1 PREDICTED: uncharacterized protein LOC109584027 [Amphimedon queenslandica]
MTMHMEFNSPKAFNDAKTLWNAISLDVGNRDAPSNMTDEIWDLPPLFKSLFFETAKCCSLASRLRNSGGKNFLLMLLHTMVLGYKQKWRSCISTTTNPVTDWCGFPRKDGEARGPFIVAVSVFCNVFLRWDDCRSIDLTEIFDTVTVYLFIKDVLSDKWN